LHDLKGCPRLYATRIPTPSASSSGLTYDLGDHFDS
jgi:hypothetical protein